MRGVPRERRRDLGRGIVLQRHAENARRAADDLLDVLVRVEVEPVDDPEPRAQRRRQQAGARRRTDERELLQRHLHRARARTLPDDDVELVVLHRGIEDLFDRRRHAVDLVDEEHRVLLEIGQHAGEIAGPLDHRSGSGANGDAHLVADDVGQRRLPQPRRTVQQHVIERLATAARGRNRHVQVVAETVLPDVLVERSRTQSRLVLRVLVYSTRSNQSFVHV